MDKLKRRVNDKGYFTDAQGNVTDERGNVIFEKSQLDKDGDIPKVYRAGLLR